MRHKCILSALLLSGIALEGVAAASLDYKALLEEYESLRNDADVVSFLSRNLEDARRFEKLEQRLNAAENTFREAVAGVERIPQPQPQSRARAVGLLALLSGDKQLDAAGEALVKDAERQQHRDIENEQMRQALHSRAVAASETWADTLVELVAGYRKVKAAAVAAGKAAAKSANAKKQRPSDRR
jgi:hypothetical protein